MMIPRAPARTPATPMYCFGMPRASHSRLAQAAAWRIIARGLRTPSTVPSLSHCARVQRANPHSSALTERALPFSRVHAARSRGTQSTNPLPSMPTCEEAFWLRLKKAYRSSLLRVPSAVCKHTQMTFAPYRELLGRAIVVLHFLDSEAASLDDQAAVCPIDGQGVRGPELDALELD